MTRAAILVEQNWNAVPGGTARATNDLICSLLAFTDIDVVGVQGTHLKKPTLSLPEGLVTKTIPVPGRALTEGWSRGERPMIGRWVETDVVHAPAYVLPATAKPLVATIHDLAFVRFPEWFTQNGVAFFDRFLDRVIEQRLNVIVPSQITADDCAVKGIAEDLIHVIPWGSDAKQAAPEQIAAVRTKYSLPEEFVLFVGTLEPRKNLDTLAEAMKALPDVALVVAGPTGWGDVKMPEDAQILGFVPEGEVEPLMAAATVLAYPSHFEGFGLPVLEAMAQGTPVVTTRRTAPAEILGKGGLAVETRLASVLADAIGQLMGSRSDRRRMGMAGRERAATYQWERTARQTAAVYERLA